MLPRMRRAAPREWSKKSTHVRRCLELAALAAFGLSSACSVYTSELLEQTTNITAGGSDGASAGKLGSLAGSSSSSGGKVGGEKPVGGDGGNEPDPTNLPGGGKAGATSSNGGSAGTGTPGGSTGAWGGNAGAAGGAGAPTDPGDLLDGFEDEDTTLEPTDGRGGVWYLFDDATAGAAGPSPLTCSPLTEAPVALGDYGMHITAQGFSGFGSGLGVDFRAGKKVYDAGRFTGIRFWAKVGAGKNTKHRVQIADATTDKAGGKCNPAAAAPNGEKCDDHFGVNATFTTSWAAYSFTFQQLTQLGWGLPAASIDKAALYGLQVTAKPKLEVDLWLDQIEFF